MFEKIDSRLLRRTTCRLSGIQRIVVGRPLVVRERLAGFLAHLTRWPGAVPVYSEVGNPLYLMWILDRGRYLAQSNRGRWMRWIDEGMVDRMKTNAVYIGKGWNTVTL